MVDDGLRVKPRKNLVGALFLQRSLYHVYLDRGHKIKDRKMFTFLARANPVEQRWFWGAVIAFGRQLLGNGCFLAGHVARASL